MRIRQSHIKLGTYNIQHHQLGKLCGGSQARGTEARAAVVRLELSPDLQGVLGVPLG